MSGDLAEVGECVAVLAAARTPTELLHAITELEMALTIAREQTVARAVVMDGWSWPRIGAALGITRQGAAKRYGPVVWTFLNAQARSWRNAS